MATRWLVEYSGLNWCMNAVYSNQDAAAEAAHTSAGRVAAGLPVAFTHWISGYDVVRYDVTCIQVLRWDALRNDWLPTGAPHPISPLTAKES